MSESTPAEGVKAEPVKITFNNKEYSVDDLSNLQNDVSSTQNSLMSDYNTKMTEAKQLKADALAQAQALEEDLAYYNAHPELVTMPNPEDYYRPKALGGKGEIAQIPEDNDDFTGGTTVKKSMFREDPAIKAMKAELAEMKQIIMGVQLETNETGTTRVIGTKERLMAKYPNVKYLDKVVNTALVEAYYKNGKKHPTDVQVEEIFKGINSDVSKLIASQGGGVVKERPPQNPQSATPTASGAVASQGKPKVPSLESSGFNDWIKDTAKKHLALGG